MFGFYGNKFADLWRDLDLAAIKEAWRSELRGYTAEEIATGIAGCRTRAWPPTLPEFLMLCRPPINPHVAWMQAQEGARRRDEGQPGFTDERVFEAYRRMAMEIRSGQPCRYALLDQWTATLAKVEAEVAAGARFPITPPLVELPSPPPLTREQANRHMQTLREKVAEIKQRKAAAAAAIETEENGQEGQEEGSKP